MACIVRCEYEEIVSAGLKPRQLKKCLWWAGKIEEKIIGHAGLLPISKNRMRLVNAFVKPEFRGKGIGLLLYDARMAFAISRKIEFLEVRTKDQQRYLKRGWKMQKRFKVYFLFQKEI